MITGISTLINAIPAVATSVPPSTTKGPSQTRISSPATSMSSAAETVRPSPIRRDNHGAPSPAAAKHRPGNVVRTAGPGVRGAQCSTHLREQGPHTGDRGTQVQRGQDHRNGQQCTAGCHSRGPEFGGTLKLQLEVVLVLAERFGARSAGGAGHLT